MPVYRKLGDGDAQAGFQKTYAMSYQDLSKAVHDARWRAGELHIKDPETHHLLEQAMWRLLRAETRCHFYWGEAWVPRALNEMQAAREHLDQATARLEA
jgi:hypothetical protein